VIESFENVPVPVRRHNCVQFVRFSKNSFIRGSPLYPDIGNNPLDITVLTKDWNSRGHDFLAAFSPLVISRRIVWASGTDSSHHC
jgi:hypothetical protein